MKKQVVIIHGGDSVGSDEEFLKNLKNLEVTKESFYPKVDWKTNLPKDLGEDFEVLAPRMPNKYNAKFEHWKVWFEKMIPFMQEAILIGHSLGGTFLVKYLSENKFPKKIAVLILVAAADSGTEGTGDFAFTGKITNVTEQCGNIYIFHSKDDPIVPIDAAYFFQKNLPQAKLRLFEDRQHFNQKDFPEIIRLIHKIANCK